MSGLAAPPAAEDGSIWIEEIVERNAELLSAIAENQGLGRLADAVMYQELFQENVLRLCQFCDLSNEALSADATLGGLIDGAASRARDPPRPSGDDVRLLVENVACAECKAVKNSGWKCRQELGHLGPNWDYVAPGVFADAPLPTEGTEAAQFAAFQRQRRQSREEKAEQQRKRQRREQEANRLEVEKLKAAPAAPAAPADNNARRRWTDAETALFLEGLEALGRKEYKRIAAEYVKTRSKEQVRSKIQKHFKSEDKKKKDAEGPA